MTHRIVKYSIKFIICALISGEFGELLWCLVVDKGQTRTGSGRFILSVGGAVNVRANPTPPA